MLYGLQVDGGEYRSLRDLVGRVEATPSGNVSLRVGREVGAGQGWTQAAYIVLTPEEAETFAEELQAVARPPSDEVAAVGRRREVLVHLNVTPPENDGRTADEIADAILAAYEVGADNDATRSLDVCCPFAESIGR